MRTILFARQFAPLVFAGLKGCTIRRHRDDRPVAVGERMSLRAWSGLPYRSKQIRLRDVTITSVSDVTMGWDREYDGRWTLHVLIDRRPINGCEIDRLWRMDGFKTPMEFLKWFLPSPSDYFCGRIIRWQPRALFAPIQ